MGMDGLSMSNTGIRREATSLDHSKESEEVAKQDTEKSMIVQELTEQERVNEEREENKKRRKSQKGTSGNESEEDSEEGEESDESESENVDEDDAESEISAENLLLVDGENQGFYTKLSKNLENIELYDRITDRLIGTITPEELSALISKLNMGTGIFINKKV